MAKKRSLSLMLVVRDYPIIPEMDAGMHKYTRPRETDPGPGPQDGGTPNRPAAHRPFPPL